MRYYSYYYGAATYPPIHCDEFDAHRLRLAERFGLYAEAAGIDLEFETMQMPRLYRVYRRSGHGSSRLVVSINRCLSNADLADLLERFISKLPRCLARRTHHGCLPDTERTPPGEFWEWPSNEFLFVAPLFFWTGGLN